MGITDGTPLKMTTKFYINTLNSNSNKQIVDGNCTEYFFNNQKKGAVCKNDKETCIIIGHTAYKDFDGDGIIDKTYDTQEGGLYNENWNVNDSAIDPATGSIFRKLNQHRTIKFRSDH